MMTKITANGVGNKMTGEAAGEMEEFFAVGALVHCCKRCVLASLVSVGRIISSTAKGMQRIMVFWYEEVRWLTMTDK